MIIRLHCGFVKLPFSFALLLALGALQNFRFSALPRKVPNRKVFVRMLSGMGRVPDRTDHSPQDSSATLSPQHAGEAPNRKLVVRMLSGMHEVRSVVCFMG